MDKFIIGFFIGAILMGTLANILPTNNLFGKLDGYCYEKTEE